MRKTPTIPAAAARLKYRRLQREQRAKERAASWEAFSVESNPEIQRLLDLCSSSAPIVPAPSRRERSALVWGFVYAGLFALVGLTAAAHGSLSWMGAVALVCWLVLCADSFSTWGRLRDAREFPQHTEV